MKRLRDALYRACLGMLPHRYQKRLFIDLAERHGVSKIRVTGRYGEISGLVDDDRPRFKTYFRDGWCRDNQIRILVDYFKDGAGGTFLDIGANIGIVTMAIAGNPRVTVHAFEPESAAFSLLEENIRHNIGSNNVHLHNVAVFSDARTLAFDSRPHHHWVDSSAAAATGKILVAGNRLDAVLDSSRLARPLAIKIDAGGSEYQAYLGARSFTSVAGLAIFEYCPYRLRRLDTDINRLLDMMREDFKYASVLRTGYSAVPVELPPFDHITRELQQMWDEDTGSDVVDILLSKNRSLRISSAQL